MKTITKETLDNTKIRVTPEQSKKVQEEIAIPLGFTWDKGKTKVRFINKPFLFFEEGGKILHANKNQEHLFVEDSNKEIFYSDLFPETESITPEWLEAEEVVLYKRAMSEYFRMHDYKNMYEYFLTHIVPQLEKFTRSTNENGLDRLVNGENI